MAGRRGVARGGRINLADFNNSVRGRGQGPSQGFAQPREECNEGLGLGFGVGFAAEEGGNLECGGGEEGSGSQRRSSRGSADHHFRRPDEVEAEFGVAPVRTDLARGRGRGSASAALLRGRGAAGTRGSASAALLRRRGAVGARGRAIPIATEGAGWSASQSGQRSGRGRGAPIFEAAERFSPSPTQEDALQEDSATEVWEGDVHDTEKSTKGKNFQPEEERQLTRSVLRISQDAIVGNGQKGKAYWERICKHFNEHRPFHSRPLRSLETKWSVIKHDVSKYIGVLQQCSNLNVSGANVADVQRKAFELYRLKSPKNSEFTFLHVWEIVKDVPRWNLGCTWEKTTAPVTKRKDAPSNSGTCSGQPLASTSGIGGSGSPLVSLRPEGSKKAKEDHRVTTLAESATRAQATATKAMADATFKKMQVIEDQNMFMLMTHSVDGVLSATATRYLKLRQEQALKKLESRILEEEASEANVRHSPPSIPVETADDLQRRVDSALHAVRHSPTQQRSPNLTEGPQGSESLMQGNADEGGDLFFDHSDVGQGDSGQRLVGSEDDFISETQPSNYRQQGQGFGSDLGEFDFGRVDAVTHLGGESDEIEEEEPEEASFDLNSSLFEQ